MFKIAITVRNRLEITKKCLEALIRHTKGDYHLYIYDNLTNYKLENHFALYYSLFSDGIIKQVTFNSKESTFDSFSKVVALNQFGKLHEEDPDKDKFDFLLFMDNDIIVTNGWDEILTQAWSDVKRLQYYDVKIIGQAPGGIKEKRKCPNKIAGGEALLGKFGGSGFWSVRSNFYREIGFLDVSNLKGINKKHDQMYWKKLQKATNSKSYIMGLKKKLCVHCGGMAGSVCNVISQGADDRKMEQIKFKDKDTNIGKMSFSDFYKKIINDKKLSNNW